MPYAARNTVCVLQCTVCTILGGMEAYRVHVHVWPSWARGVSPVD